MDETFKFIVPIAHERHFGLNDFEVVWHFSVTAMASLWTTPLMKTALLGSPRTKSALFSKPPSTFSFCLGSDKLRAEVDDAAAERRVFGASNTTGMSVVLGFMGRATILTPGIKFLESNSMGPPKSARVAWMIAP